MSKQKEIFDSMNAQKERTEHIKEANTTSKTGVVRNILYVVSEAIAILYEMFKSFKTEVAEISNQNERRTPSWYQQKALDFQYGYELAEGKDYYDNSLLTEGEIEASKIVAFAVAVEEVDKSTLYIKIANKNKEPLSDQELEAFRAYMQEVSDIGVHISIRNEMPDNLQLSLTVFYNATLLNSLGQELTSTSEPVKEAIQNYISNLNFNQEYIDMRLVDALQQLPAVEIAEVDISFYKYKQLSWQKIKGRYIPFAGHLIIEDEDLTINYIKY